MIFKIVSFENIQLLDHSRWLNIELVWFLYSAVTHHAHTKKGNYKTFKSYNEMGKKYTEILY